MNDPADHPMNTDALVLAPIGHVESTLSDPSQAPCQGDEGAPDAWLVLNKEVAEGLDGLRAGSDVLVLTCSSVSQSTSICALA